MKKNLLYTSLSLIGIMGALAIGVVNAEVSEPYGHVEYTLNENKDFEAQVITITDGEDTITILDRNLGATDAGTGCEDPSWGTACAEGDATYGYHFQRGNNYGFKSTGEVQSGTDKAEWNSAYANKGYYGTTYIKSDWNPYGGDWWEDSTNNSANHYNLWGGSLTETTDGAGNTIVIWDADYLNGNDWKVNPDTVKNRQGPCPENFHVPSAGELAKLTKMFGLDNEWNNYEEVSSAMHSQLKIPFAGLRYYDDALACNLGGDAYLWSSSPISASFPYARAFSLNVGGGFGVGYYGRVYAYSVRCFYDFYQPFPQSLTLSFTGSEGGSVSTGSIEAEKGSSISRDDEVGTVSISGTVVATGTSDEGYVFSGWLTDCDGDTVTTGCSFTGVFKPIPYTITYLGTGDDYVPSATGFTIKSVDITLSDPSKTGYTFTGRSGTNIEGITGTVTISKGSTGDRVYEANWEVNEYEITYELDGGVNNSKNVTGYTIEDTVIFENPTKEGFTFDGWFTDAQFTTGITTIPTGTTGPITLYAKWTENKKSSGSSGGGGRSSRTSDTQDSSTSSQNDKNTENVIQSDPEHSEWGSEESSKTPMDSSDKSSEGQEILSPSDNSFTKEQKDAYEFAHEKGITTMPTIQKADMDGKLTRIAMAKMLSQYAINVLGKTPDATLNNKFNDVTDKQNSDYDDGVTLVYQLGIMGQNMPNNKFRPNDEVTRAEFATALSRMIYHTSDGEYKSTPKYYIHHMEKLVKEGIITKDDPNMKELRGYVMIMLMRSAK